MKSFPFLLAFASLTAAGSACQQKMSVEGRIREDSAVESLPGGTSAQPPVEGTVPFRGGEKSAAAVQVTAIERIRRGRVEYETFCAPCHGIAGYGDGRVVQRGFTAPPSLHDPRLRDVPDGHIEEVIAKGFGAMPSYGSRIPESERPGLVAYLRALQRSQHADVRNLPEADREELQR